jgi:hypothetical protein
LTSSPGIIWWAVYMLAFYFALRIEQKRRVLARTTSVEYVDAQTRTLSKIAMAGQRIDIVSSSHSLDERVHPTHDENQRRKAQKPHRYPQRTGIAPVRKLYRRSK